MTKRAKGDGCVYKRKDGRWEGRYIDCLGERHSIYGKTKKEVNEKLNKLTYLNNTTQPNKLRGDIKLDIWFERYIIIKKELIKERSITKIISAYKNHISPMMGDKIMCFIAKEDAIWLKKSLVDKGLSPSSINGVLRHAKAMFNFALNEHMIDSNPFNYISMVKENRSDRRGLSDEEIKQIMTTAKELDETFHLMLCTLLYTGIRVGELCALKWNDFTDNFDSVIIDESLTDIYYENDTKTKSSERTVPLMDILSKEYKKLYNILQPRGDEYVFTTSRGGSYYSLLIDKRFKYVRECASKKYNNPNLLSITPHYFRHTFASRAISGNVNIKDIQELLGHSSSRTTLDIYAHTTGTAKRKSVSIIEGSINYKNDISDGDLTPHRHRRYSTIK